MKIQFLTAILILISNFCYTQEYDKVTYYSDKYANHEVEKGKYMIVEKTVNDSILKKEFIVVKKNMVEWTKYYLNDKPYGIWKYYDKKGKVDGQRNYNFILKYGEYIPEGVYKLKDLLEEASPNFEMPIFNGKESKEGIDMHVRNTFRYPEIAQKKNIQGKVLAQFTIDKEGKVKNLSIVKSAGESLDREVYRILHIMPDWRPALLNGKPIEVYITYPIGFKLN